jgi:hypothetical protein
MQCFIQQGAVTETFGRCFLPPPPWSPRGTSEAAFRADDPLGARLQQRFNQVKSCPSKELLLMFPLLSFVFPPFRSDNVTSSERSELNKKVKAVLN